MDEKTEGVFFLFNNQWVITVFGGLILTGLIKIIEMFFNRIKDNRDVKQANKEVVNFLSKVIINRTILNGDFIEAIMHSIARNNNVPLKKMNLNVDMVEDTLIKLYEIDYLPMDEKNDMVDNLLKLKETIRTKKIINQNLNTVENQNNYSKVFYQSLHLVKELIPLYLLMLILLMTIMVLFPEIYGGTTTLSSNIELQMMSVLLLVATTLVIILFIINSRRRRTARSRYMETDKLIDKLLFNNKKIDFSQKDKKSTKKRY